MASVVWSSGLRSASPSLPDALANVPSQSDLRTFVTVYRERDNALLVAEIKPIAYLVMRDREHREEGLDLPARAIREKHRVLAAGREETIHLQHPPIVSSICNPQRDELHPGDDDGAHRMRCKGFDVHCPVVAHAPSAAFQVRTA